MAIKDITFSDPFVMDVKDGSDVFEALNALHSQILDNLGENHPLLKPVEKAMDAAMSYEFGDEDEDD